MIGRETSVRVTFHDDGNAISISVAARRSWIGLILFPAFLCAWAYCEWDLGRGAAHLIAMAFDGGTTWSNVALVIFGLCLWTLGAPGIVYGWIWMAFGREHMRVDGTTVAIWREPIGFPRRREFDLASTGRMRVVPPPLFRRWREVGTIRFDWVGRTIHFGAALGEGEARNLVDAMTRRFPQLASPAAPSFTPVQAGER